MEDKSKQTAPASGQATPTRPQMPVRTDVRAGEGCEAGIGYWRSEYNYWKQRAKDLGCV